MGVIECHYTEFNRILQQGCSSTTLLALMSYATNHNFVVITYCEWLTLFSLMTIVGSTCMFHQSTHTTSMGCGWFLCLHEEINWLGC
jgi:hypothetical protein